MRGFSAMAAFVAGVALAVFSQAQAMPRDRGPEPGPARERAQPQRGGGGRGPGPGINRAMPPQGFRGAPPDFRGQLPGPGPSGRGGFQGRPGFHFHGRPGVQMHPDGRFRGHRFEHFSPPERRLWEGGDWRRTWHDGHLGWWWVVSGDWFFYPQPIYPYPLYVGPSYYYDYYGTYGPPSYYWYYCEDPPGYYPYVPRCFVPWQTVPPASE